MEKTDSKVELDGPSSETQAHAVHLIDLVPMECCQSRPSLEEQVARLESALNEWLREKLLEIEGHSVPDESPIVTNNDECDGPSEVSMSTDNRDILEVLKAELDFVESGGYGRSPRTPWKARSIFQGSLSCINYAYPEKVHPCNECHLIDFVPQKDRSQEVPCHFIPLTEEGETLSEIEAEDNQAKLEAALKNWLLTKIREIEAARAGIQKTS